MDTAERIERALESAFCRGLRQDCPPRLAGAMRHAVFPGGARIRPRLCLAVAASCGGADQRSVDAAAAAIEFLHCASLVHDDLPCFDDAPTRRGRPTVHRVYGEPLALLAGDALILLAFDAIAGATPSAVPALVGVLARAVGAGGGLCAGQAWEQEPRVNLNAYHRAKTGALFACATMAGAISAGRDGATWRHLGERIGAAYQVADDLRDVAGRTSEIGKPIGRDAALGRPNAALEFGVHGALERLDALLADAASSIPDCPGAAALREYLLGEARALVPSGLAQRVA
jgi:geranylgeranyl diphosphate synthase type II